MDTQTRTHIQGRRHDMASGATPQTASTGVARRRRLGRTLAAAVVVAGAAITPAVVTAAPASAAVSGCSHGYVDGHKAWGTCTKGSGSWNLTVQCYYWGANTAYGSGPGTIYATCPNTSHITSVVLHTQQ